jgi:hypothetical protein
MGISQSHLAYTCYEKAFASAGLSPTLLNQSKQRQRWEQAAWNSRLDSGKRGDKF